MSEIKIITNNQPRDILCGFQLPDKYRKEFDYLTDDEYGDHAFFIYKKQVYDLSEFIFADGFKKWDGISSDALFSGVLIRVVNDGDSVIVGRFYC